MPKLTESARVVTDFKTLVVLAGMLLAAGAAGYQIRDLTARVEVLQAKQAAQERAIIEVVTTLKVKGVIQ